MTIKTALPRIRPLLHCLLMFAPTVTVLLIIPKSRVLMVSGTVSLGIELAQYLFGFGFDGLDILDLVWNAAGIGLAIWIHPLLARWWRSHAASPRR